MSMNFGASQSSGSQNQSQTTNPWAPAVPYLQDMLQQMWGRWQGQGSGAPTRTQTGAFNTLEANAAQGDPNAGATRQLSTNLMNSGSWTPTLMDSYNSMKANLNPTATMDVDPTTNPGIQGLLSTVRNDVTNSVNQQFAAAGRDMSGANSQALGRGIEQAEAPILLNQYNQNVQAKSAANEALQQAGLATSQTGQGLDQANAALREAGIGVGQQALASQNYGPNSLLQLEQQRLGLPFQNMGMLASLLFPMAGLGGSSYGQGNWNADRTSEGMGFNLFSDERAKENKEQIGAMLDGTPIYRYNYKGDDPQDVKMGPMAQDVEKQNPAAVADVGPGGLKMVNTDLATRKAAMIGKLKKFTPADRAALAMRG